MKSNRSKHYPTIDLVASYDYTDSSSGGRFGSITTEASTLGIYIKVDTKALKLMNQGIYLKMLKLILIN